MVIACDHIQSFMCLLQFFDSEAHLSPFLSQLLLQLLLFQITSLLFSCGTKRFRLKMLVSSLVLLERFERAFALATARNLELTIMKALSGVYEEGRAPGSEVFRLLALETCFSYSFPQLAITGPGAEIDCRNSPLSRTGEGMPCRPRLSKPC